MDMKYFFKIQTLYINIETLKVINLVLRPTLDINLTIINVSYATIWTLWAFGALRCHNTIFFQKIILIFNHLSIDTNGLWKDYFHQTQKPQNIGEFDS